MKLGDLELFAAGNAANLSVPVPVRAFGPHELARVTPGPGAGGRTEYSVEFAPRLLVLCGVRNSTGHRQVRNATRAVERVFRSLRWAIAWRAVGDVLVAELVARAVDSATPAPGRTE